MGDLSVLGPDIHRDLLSELNPKEMDYQPFCMGNTSW
jgi:hypothetical protein